MFYGLDETLLADQCDDNSVFEIKDEEHLMSGRLYSDMMIKGATSLSHTANCDVIVGADKTTIRINRSVFAMQCAVLSRLAFGTEDMPMDESRPIELPHFDAEAVKIALGP